MPWYFYNGRVPVPVKSVDGVVVSVPPRGHVEASPNDVRKYGSRMRRCAPPAGAADAAKPEPTVVAPPKKVSPLAAAVKEKGVTSDPARAPKKREVAEEQSAAPKRRSRSRKKTEPAAE